MTNSNKSSNNSNNFFQRVYWAAAASGNLLLLTVSMKMVTSATSKILMWVYWLMIVLVLCSISTAASQNPADSKPGCRDRCGNVSVPYPFGIGDPSCAINEYLFLNCSKSSTDGHDPERLLIYDLPVLNISVPDGLLTVSINTSYDCYNQSGAQVMNSLFSINLGQGPYMFSDTENMLMGIGCDTMAFVLNSESTFGAACVSLCNGMVTLKENTSCSGVGCCKTSIPQGLKHVSVSSLSLYNHTNVSVFNPCGYAFLADKKSFKASDWQISGLPYGNASDVVLEWVVENKKCTQAQANTSSYGCSNNTDCVYFENGQGYRCFCKDGFTGNPYLSPGCQDINECADLQRYPCEGKCKNTPGNYTCTCPVGMHGNGKRGCQGFAIANIAYVIGAVVGVLLLLMGAWWLHKLTKKRRSIQMRREFFQRNGGLLLQQHLSSGDYGEIRKTRVFCSKELEAATDSFNVNRILGQGGQGTVYKGMLENGEIVAVKRSKIVDEGNLEGFINEVVILSQINHRNIVRLLGCCLETEVPLLVYEFVPNGTLYQYLHIQNEEFSLSWEMRLKIATEIAGALSYLHSSASIPIYHRDIKSTNILLDGKYRSKIADFGTSRSFFIDQTHLTTDVKGTIGYLDPEYFQSSQLTEKSDVYSFGVVLVELLSGQKPILSNLPSHEIKGLAAHFLNLMEQNRLFDILDAQVKEQSPEYEATAVANLAKRCLSLNGKKRPTMKEVAMELESIGLSRRKMDVQQNIEEDEHIMDQVPSMWDVASASITCSGFPDGIYQASDVEPLVTFRTW